MRSSSAKRSPSSLYNLRTGYDEASGYFEAFGAATQTTEFEPQRYSSQGDMIVMLGKVTFSIACTGKVIIINSDWVNTF